MHVYSETSGIRDVPPSPGPGPRPPGDPRLGWGRPPVPVLRQRRDGILPTVAAALSLPGRDHPLTGTASRSGPPPALHPAVRDVLDGLPTEQRERHGGRCPEAVLLSRHLTASGAQRSGQVRRALKNARITTRYIREDGDPRHGEYAPHCRSCTALLGHFGVRSVSPAGEDTPRVPGRRTTRRSAGRAPGDAGTVVEEALLAAGWQPGRREGAPAEQWADTLRAHLSPAGHAHRIFPVAFEIWAEYGGLRLVPPGPGHEFAPSPVSLDPLLGLHWARTLGDLGRALDTELSPLGAEDGGRALLAVDRDGRVYCLDHSGDWYLGPDIRTALATLLAGTPPARLSPP